MNKVLTFDLDDTLYPEKDYVKSGFYAVDKFLNDKKIEGFFDKAWNYFLSGGRGNTFNVVLDSLDINYDEQLIKELVNVYREHKPNIVLDAQVLNLLINFSKKYQLALITDGFSIAQHNKIKALGLENYINKIIVTDDLGINREFWKPHTKAYELVKDFYNVEHRECVYIGDNEKKDFISANQLGWTTVRIVRDDGEYSEQQLDAHYQANYKLLRLEQLNSLF